jgi:hypothetical protein
MTSTRGRRVSRPGVATAVLSAGAGPRSSRPNPSSARISATPGVHPCGRRRRRHRRGRGTRPGCRDADAASRRRCRPPGQPATPPGDGCPCRPGHCRRYGRGAARSRRPRARPHCWAGGRAAFGSGAAGCCGRPAGQAHRQAAPSAPSQRQADLLQHPARQRAPASIPRGQAGDLLGERAGWAGGVVAEEPADPQSDHHRPAANGRVGQGALIAAVHLG